MIELPPRLCNGEREEDGNTGNAAKRHCAGRDEREEENVGGEKVTVPEETAPEVEDEESNQSGKKNLEREGEAWTEPPESNGTEEKEKTKHKEGETEEGGWM